MGINNDFKRAINRIDAANLFEYKYDSDDDVHYYHTKYTISNGPTVSVVVILNEQAQDACFRIFGLAKIEEDSKMMAAVRLVNKLNGKYKFAKFVLDDEMTIDVNVDIPFGDSDDDKGEHLMRGVGKLVSITNDVYPEIMRLIWS